LVTNKSESELLLTQINMLSRHRARYIIVAQLIK